MKYLVMECHVGYAVLLDEEGRFVKAANFHYQVGQTVEDPVLMKETAPGKRKLPRVMISAAAAACFLLLFDGYYQNYLYSDTAIYLTINPSVRMELNRKGSVVRLTAANEDGEKLLENYKRSSNDRLKVLDELIARAIDMGFLSEGGLVTIDIDAPDEVYFQKYGVEFRSNLTEYLENQLTIDIHIVDHDLKQMETEPEKTEEPKEEVSAAPSENPNTQGTSGEAADPESSGANPAAAKQSPAQVPTNSVPAIPPASASSPASSEPKEPPASTAPAASSEPAASAVPTPPVDHSTSDTDYEPDDKNTDYGTDYDRDDEGTDYGTDYDTDDGVTDYGTDYSTDDGSDYGSDYESSDYE